MPIRQFLDGQQFGAETIRVMGIAFELARASTLRLDRPDITDDAIGKQIIVLAEGGERNIEQLCDRTLALLSAPS
jgi:hypothetical protein